MQRLRSPWIFDHDFDLLGDVLLSHDGRYLLDVWGDDGDLIGPERPSTAAPLPSTEANTLDLTPSSFGQSGHNWLGAGALSSPTKPGSTVDAIGEPTESVVRVSASAQASKS